MTVGTLGCHCETFRKKLDAYFAEHAQEIQKSIREWGAYNLHKPEYRITEQELKDVILHWRENVVRYLCLSLEHQIQFFPYYTYHMYACKKAAELKKRFDREQVREYALRDLDDMMEQFQVRGIARPRLIECRKVCASYLAPNPSGASLDALESKLKFLIFTDKEHSIAGNREYWEQTVNDIYEIERTEDFFKYILFSWSELYEGFFHMDIERMFGERFSVYTKWNPDAYPGWEAREYPVVRRNGRLIITTVPIPRTQWRWNSEVFGGILRVVPYPKHCLDGWIKHDIQKLFLKEDLVQTYLKVMKRLPECVRFACVLCQAYAETKFSAEGKKKSTTFAWDDWRLKRVALLMAWETDFRSIKDLLCKHKEFFCTCG
jgi:hypothetical protein